MMGFSKNDVEHTEIIIVLGDGPGSEVEIAPIGRNVSLALVFPRENHYRRVYLTKDEARKIAAQLLSLTESINVRKKRRSQKWRL